MTEAERKAEQWLKEYLRGEEPIELELVKDREWVPEEAVIGYDPRNHINGRRRKR